VENDKGVLQCLHYNDEAQVPHEEAAEAFFDLFVLLLDFIGFS